VLSVVLFREGLLISGKVKHMYKIRVSQNSGAGGSAEIRSKFGIPTMTTKGLPFFILGDNRPFPCKQGKGQLSPKMKAILNIILLP
jgi:hypothetical protein